MYINIFEKTMFNKNHLTVKIKMHVIVKSPGEKIQTYLGDKYIINASFVHIRDLPKDKLNIETKQSI